MTTTYKLYNVDNAHTPQLISGSVDLRRAIALGAQTRGITPAEFRILLNTWQCKADDQLSFGPPSPAFCGALTFEDYHQWLMVNAPEHRPASVQRMARHIDVPADRALWEVYFACAGAFAVWLIWLVVSP